MSGYLTIGSPVRRAGAGLGRAAESVWTAWRHRMQLRATRRYLEQMDEHMLHDIGVSRAQALFEVDAPHRVSKRG